MDNVIFSSDIQFFYSLLLALETAIVGWYQAKNIKSAIEKAKELADKLTQKADEKNPNGQKIISEVKAVITKLESKENLNNCFFGWGKFFIISLSLLIIISILITIFFNKALIFFTICFSYHWAMLVLLILVLAHLLWSIYLDKYVIKIQKGLEHDLEILEIVSDSQDFQ